MDVSFNFQCFIESSQATCFTFTLLHEIDLDQFGENCFG